MQRINGSALYHCVEILERLGGVSIFVDDEKDKAFGSYPQDSEIRKNIPYLLREVAWLREGLQILGANVTDMRAEELEISLREETCTHGELCSTCQDIGRRLKHEMSTLLLFLLDGKDRRYIDQNEPLFGVEVADRFPAAAFDIEEAGKCLALERYTAVAFHLMRTIEIGIHALSDALNLTINSKSGWLTILNKKLEPAIESFPESTPSERQRKRYLQQARAHLHAIRLGWRNDTMHPKATYTEEEARDLTEHVGNFMRHLATKLQE